MHDKKEIGYFSKYGKELNDAYALFASLYLDYVDASLGHFLGRGVDVAPIESVDSDDEHVLAVAYMDYALDIARTELESETVPIEAKREMLSLYPMLRDYIDVSSIVA